jgi:hypothetical protein
MSAYINVDPLNNQLTLFTGLDYFSRTQGNSTGVLFPNSRCTRKDAVTSASIPYWSVSTAFQYNIHFEKLTLSPSLNLESIPLLAAKNQFFKISDNRVIYYIEGFNSNLMRINLGAKTSLGKNIYGPFKPSYITQLKGQNANTGRPISSTSGIIRLSLSVGCGLF